MKKIDRQITELGLIGDFIIYYITLAFGLAKTFAPLSRRVANYTNLTLYLVKVSFK